MQITFLLALLVLGLESFSNSYAASKGCTYTIAYPNNIPVRSLESQGRPCWNNNEEYERRLQFMAQSELEKNNSTEFYIKQLSSMF